MANPHLGFARIKLKGRKGTTP